MQKIICRALAAGLIFLLLVSLSACASRQHPVRHLSFDVGILSPGNSEPEVMAIMGLPDIRRPTPGGGEEWLYLEAHRSLLGREEFHLARATFRNGRLIEAAYRALTREEFRAYNEQPWSDQ
ncbi:MAG TPA: hypothetical protein ENN98_06960 [Desulfurivibrio alkaliphilus]|uniref:Lipoprotein SmpA/OmlA domain-containing protein n=1 Tax=Desulfurivibrio alkaliphilus TaxID=427923 RepID=A0A7C2XAR3_9BACT|nr:hypothetical protein [Desulfurivibrio alkaliphilus]